MRFFDTNVLVYAATDQDPRKNRIAAYLTARAFGERSHLKRMLEGAGGLLGHLQKHRVARIREFPQP